MIKHHLLLYTDMTMKRFNFLWEWRSSVSEGRPASAPKSTKEIKLNGAKENLTTTLDSLPESPTPEEVVAFMRKSSSEDERNTRCDEVKRRFNGNYPGFWFEEIVKPWVRPQWKKPSPNDVMVVEVLQLKPINFFGRPTALPPLWAWEKLVCGFDNGLGEKKIVCETLEDAQSLYDSYASGLALRIKWYVST